MSRLRFVPGTAALAAAWTTLFAMPHTASAAACTNADAAPSAGAEEATLCLLNNQRRSHGLRALRNSAQLAGAADTFAGLMVSSGFFAHNSPSGSTPQSRDRATGYLKGARSWALAENIGNGTGAAGTPRRIVAAWMRSAPHRRNILDGRLRDIGIGIETGVPGKAASGATYVTDFGRR